MSLSVDEALTRARTRTGLEDFGDARFEDSLRALLDAARDEGQLKRAGEAILAHWVAERLENRLRVVAHANAHASELRAPKRPLFVSGMLRTGTTILTELLACDPDNRPLMKWEALDSIPPPRTETFRDDPRIAKTVGAVERMFAMVPALRAVHYEPGHGPTECVALMGQSFLSQDFTGLFVIPSYVKHFHGADLRPAYEFHKLALSVLASRAPGRWVLKAPGHLLALDALIDTYPDARLVVCHRAPRSTVASSISLSLTSRPESITRRDATETRAYFGRYWFDALSLMVDRMMAFRDARPEIPVYDVDYDRLMRDPVAELRRLYAFFGDELSPVAAAAMQHHLDTNPKGKHGAHAYELAEFGVTESEVDTRFATYCQRFDVRTGATP